MRYVRTSLLLCLYILISACASMGGYTESPRVSLVNLQPQGMTLFEQTYNMQLRIQNPNDRDIPVKGLSYSLDINGDEFAYGVSKQSVTVPAFGEALLDVSATSSTINIIQQMQKMSSEKTGKLEYKLSGKISLENHPIKLPFDYEGSIDLTPQSRGKTP